MKMNITKRKISFLAVFVLTFTLCLAVTAAYVRNKSQMETAQMEQVAVTRTSKVNNVITKLLYKTQILSALVIQNNGDIEDFERVAATILDDPAIRNVILAPGGVVSHVYPLEGNESVIGLDYFSEGDGNAEAVAAKETGQLVLGGPFTLVQGGQALVGRLPVYIGGHDEKHFWGLVSVTLKYPEALAGAELEQLKTQGFAYEIWRISPDTNERQMIARSSYDYNKNARYVEHTMQILNAEWYFRLSPIRNWYQYPETWFFSFAGFLISMLAAFLVMHNYDLRLVKSELEELTFTDQLTGAPNRRSAFKTLERAARAGTPFVLCYLDLNKFKSINDTYGHGAGDSMLKYFSGVLQKTMEPQHIFSRIGGDEFLLVFMGVEKKEDTKPFFDKLRADLAQKVSFGIMEPMEITFSAGFAAFPADGTDIDGLITLADGEMYREKAKKAVNG